MNTKLHDAITKAKAILENGDAEHDAFLELLKAAELVDSHDHYMALSSSLPKDKAEAMAKFLNDFFYTHVAVRGVEVPRGDPCFFAKAEIVRGKTWTVWFRFPPRPWNSLVNYRHLEQLARAYEAGMTWNKKEQAA